jgi:hypothetical protein
MAITLWKDDITSASGGSKDAGKNFVRTLFLRHDRDDTMVDAINSVYMPKWNDCHPVYTAFFVTDIGDVEVFADDVFKIEVTYLNKVDSTEPVSAETKPWDLPPQDVNISTFDKEIAMTKYWDNDKKKWRTLLNSAGVRISATKVVTVAQLSFTMNVKSKSSIPQLNAAYLYNSNAETVCGIKIPAYCGKLLPFNATLHSVTDSSTGKIKYEYWSIGVTVQIILPTGDEGNENWSFSYLDIGTLVRDKGGNLGAIYKFRDAVKKEDLSTAKVIYGSIDELTIQRSKWDKSDIANFPYEEITEPMPLNDGKLYLEAINSPDVPYGKIIGFDSRPASWSKFDLPKRR